MKRNRLPALILAAILIVSIGLSAALAAKPPRTRLNVTITSPVDGLEVTYDVDACGEFSVEGTVLAERGDAGLVQTSVQYRGEGSTEFTDVDGAGLWIVTGGGEQPQIDTLLKDEQYHVSWTLTGEPGTYEIRLFSQGETAKDGESDSRTVTLLGPPPEPPPEPPTDYETIDDEYVDPENAFGTSSGTFVNTYFVDEVYEVLMEQPNSHGTKNPTDDTADLNWIYEFDDLDLSRNDTAFQFVGHIELSGEYLDSGFLEWDDQDTAFYVQVMSAGSWKTIAAITSIGTDRRYCVDVPDDSSPTIKLRIVDNDRGPEGKSPQISSLYVDLACIVFEPAFEYIIDDVSSGIQPGIDGIGDIDFDGENEAYFTLQIDDNGIVRYYDYADGIWTQEVLAGLNLRGWMELEDVDSDGIDDLLTMEVRSNDELWLGYHTYDDGMGEWSNFFHEIGQLLIAHRVVVGDIDGDSLNEVVASKDPCDGYELKYYDYNTTTTQWDEIDYRTWTYYTKGLELVDIDSDGADEVFWLGGSAEFPVGESALKYFDIVDGGWVEHNICNVDSGECMDIGDVDNDNDTEIVIGHYTYPERENQVRLYEYVGESWEEYIVADLTEALGPIYHVAIGDVDGDDGGANELVIGLFDDGVGLANGSIRYFEYDGGAWTEHDVADPDMTVAALQIGDLDNEPGNEILVGLTTSYSYSVVAPGLRYYKVYRMWDE